jgi:small subunit ribosomal protein S14
MTTKDYSKVKNQLGVKPAKWKKYEKHNSPKKRDTGRIINKCKFCGTTRGFVGQFGLNICRRCFRLNATKLGFKKLN